MLKTHYEADEINVTFNYEIFRDFAGTALSWIINKADRNQNIYEKDLWYVLEICALDQAIETYCSNYTACSKNELFNADYSSLEQRRNLIKYYFVDHTDNGLPEDHKLSDAMINILKKGLDNVSDDEMREVVERVNMYIMGYTWFQDIIIFLMYSDKYLAFKEYCNVQNSKAARRILYKAYCETKATYDWTYDGSYIPRWRSPQGYSLKN